MTTVEEPLSPGWVQVVVVLLAGSVLVFVVVTTVVSAEEDLELWLLLKLWLLLTGVVIVEVITVVDGLITTALEVEPFVSVVLLVDTIMDVDVVVRTVVDLVEPDPDEAEEDELDPEEADEDEPDPEEADEDEVCADVDGVIVVVVIDALMLVSVVSWLLDQVVVPVAVPSECVLVEVKVVTTVLVVVIGTEVVEVDRLGDCTLLDELDELEELAEDLLELLDPVVDVGAITVVLTDELVITVVVCVVTGLVVGTPSVPVPVLIETKVPVDVVTVEIVVLLVDEDWLLVEGDELLLLACEDEDGEDVVVG